MRTFVSEQLANLAAINGELVGKQTPCAESKWTWFEVYRYEGKLIACAVDPSYGVSCGEEIAESDLPSYIN